ncbi:DUF1648 domain-containing protein [Clostridium sardiniense]|uniref:DUF1648 domain-containing protein n=1 Tax=Clostridium sardiniense TaxID=29369 RepID=UPI0019578FA5|nr:DUF5808 domain-containing protein [Clostridium sardiniense]MBM7836098.1 putative membrane protein [Clostridium sardiniense]
MVDIGFIIIMILVILTEFFACAILAVKGKKNVLIGCIVSDEIRANDKIKQKEKEYININVIISILAILGIVISYFQNSQLIAIISMFFSIIGGMVCYGVYNKKIRELKEELGGLKDKKQVVVVSTERNKYSFKRLGYYLLIGIPVLVLNTVFAIKQYSILPDRIPTQFDFSGNITAYSEKNFFLFGGLIFSIVFMIITFIAVDYILQTKKMKIDPTNPEKSRGNNLKYRDIISKLMMCIMLVALITLTIGNLQVLQIIKNSRNAMWIVVILTAIMLIALMYYSIKAFKIRNDYETENNNVIQRDDDSKWKFGFIYYNKQDPSIFVEKRVGIGWTINAGNKIGMLLYILTLVIVVFAVGMSIVQS